MAKVRFIICDPGGSQTHNFQIRNLMFYSIELQDQFLCSGRESNPHRLSAYFFLRKARLPITTPEQLCQRTTIYFIICFTKIIKQMI